MFNQVIRLFQPVRSFLPVYGVSLLIVGSRNLIINYLTAFLESSVAAAAVAGDSRGLFAASLRFLAGVGGFIVWDTFGLYLHSTVTHRMTVTLKKKIHRKVLCAKLTAFQGAGGGKSEVLARLNQDVNLAKEIYSSSLLYPFMYLISGIGAAASICARSLAVGIPLLLVGVGGMAFQWYLGKRQRKIARSMQQALGGITAVINDLNGHSLAIRFADLSDAFERRLLQNLGRYEEGGQADARVQAELGAVGAVSYFLQFMGVILLGLFQAGQGKIEISDLFFLAQMASLMLTAFSVIGSTVVSLQRSLAGAERIEVLLHLPQECGGTVRNEAPAGGAHLLETDGVVCRFSEDASFRINGPIVIPSGKITVIRGKSGKGKSTLFKLMLGLYPYEGGSLRFRGREIRDYGLDFLRSQTAYIQQPPFIVAGTIEENMLLDTRRSPDEKEMRRAMEFSGMAEWISAFPDREKSRLAEGGAPLSGGQRQMLVIARALLKQAPVFLMDESFANMDSRHAAQILQRFKACGDRITVILISHDHRIAEQADYQTEL